MEQSADLVAITAVDGTIEYVNPAFEWLTGYTMEEVVGKKPSLLKSGVQAPAFYKNLWETVLAGNVFRGILVNKKKNGELYHAEKTITPVRDAAGKITHFISNDRDITERKRLEAQLVQATKMDAIGQLAGGVAHDFNNLLMVISSYAALQREPGGSATRAWSSGNAGLMSGYASPTLLQHGVHAGETLFLQKPFTLKMLAWKIRQALTVPNGTPAPAAETHDAG